ncbi:hypothetical protein ISN45_At03g026660, partial [Arabidopsis thaliana x Arabidopsis arenosa]
CLRCPSLSSHVGSVFGLLSLILVNIDRPN